MILDRLDEVFAAATRRLHKRIDARLRGDRPTRQRIPAMFSVKCLRCKRPLSDPKSLANGMGHTCRTRDESDFEILPVQVVDNRSSSESNVV